MHSTRPLSSITLFAHVATAEVSPPAAPDLGPLPEWKSRRPLPRHGFGALFRRSRACRERVQSLRDGISRQARGDRARPGCRNDACGAVRRYEAIEDLLGRIMSYAGLVYSGDTTDPARAKFYGDVAGARSPTASTDLLFFTLELNRIDDELLETAMDDRPARALPAVARGHPQGEALSARGQARAAVPRKGVTGRGAWNRLFDETIASCASRSTARSWPSSRRST